MEDTNLSASELLRRARLKLDRDSEDFALRVRLSDSEIRSVAKNQIPSLSSTLPLSTEGDTD